MGYKYFQTPDANASPKKNVDESSTSSESSASSNKGEVLGIPPIIDQPSGINENHRSFKTIP
jgi:hypothetical protein